MVILTKLVTGQAREPLIPASERSRMVYQRVIPSVRIGIRKIEFMLHYSTQKLGIAIIVYNHSLSQQTPLHIAAREGCDYTVKYLIDEEAAINIKDKNGVCMNILLMIH